VYERKILIAEFRIPDLFGEVLSQREEGKARQSPHGLLRAEDLEKAAVGIADLTTAGEKLDELPEVPYARQFPELCEEYESEFPFESPILTLLDQKGFL
jgi:hypothetical protein